MLEDVELIAGKRGCEAIGKADEEMFLLADGCAGDDADCAAGVDEGIVRAADFDVRDDLSSREDIVRLMHASVLAGLLFDFDNFARR